MSMQIKRYIVLVMALVVVAAGCGKKIAQPVSVLDSPEYHYKQGLKYLDKDQTDDAMREFERAIALDAKSPLGYIGRGWHSGKRASISLPWRSCRRRRAWTRALRPISA